jgi:hypothetical protein
MLCSNTKHTTTNGQATFTPYADNYILMLAWPQTAPHTAALWRKLYTYVGMTTDCSFP